MGYKQYCKNYQDIENYEAAKKDNFKGWECHHRLETHTSDGERRLVDITPAELRALGTYYNRPADELIFMTHSEHQFLHRKGKHLSEEWKKKMREVRKGKRLGKDNPFYGKHHSDEVKKKLSEINKVRMKGKNIWTRGRHWYNNGKISIRAKECPEGFVPGRIKKL